jgi:hypothetical protein
MNTSENKGRVWRVAINIWIAATLIFFFLVRILGSGTARHALPFLTGH